MSEDKKYEYTTEEIEALEYYSSRKSRKLFEQDLNYSSVNTFLRYISNDGLRNNTICRTNTRNNNKYKWS